MKDTIITLIMEGLGSQAFFDWYNGEFADYIQDGAKDDTAIRQKIDEIFDVSRVVGDDEE